MSVFSQFGIYGYAPVGASILSLDAPTNYTSGAAEYLRTGNIKTYSSAYAATIAAAPQLRVFGDAAASGAAAAGARTGLHHYYVGSRYFAVLTVGWYGSATTVQGMPLTALTGSTAAATMRAASSGTSYVVCPISGGGAHKYTADGITVTAVGGSFASSIAQSAACFGNNSWITLASLAAATGEQTYINAADPSGSWTVGASTNLSMSAVKGIAYGAGVFVAVGTSASATAGKIATTTSVGAAWTDRTTASGVTFGASDTVSDVVFDGTAFIAITSTGNIITSTTGTGAWTLVGTPMDLSSTSPLSGAASWTGGGNTGHFMSLSTDGAGTTVYQPTCSSATIRPMFSISTDHGATWTTAQAFVGKNGIGTGTRSMSYANGRWISNHGCEIGAGLDLGTSLTTPNYIGNQTNVGAGQFVRIK